MNKYCYRLVFSRAHGELRVVSEMALRSCSGPGLRCPAGITNGSRLWVTLRRAVWLPVLLMFSGPVLGDGIIADGAAVPSQRPEVIQTRNGLPQVNITAPNQAGVSHNQYQQFDVNARGAILNNSAVMTQTQMAGMIQGNPNLSPGAAPARVILNEVNSSDPSQLRGFMEVAGGRAQVIVANPSGILCDGCGTINAGRMTLTTGRPQLNADGSLAGYQVERGVVRIEGGGLNGDARHDTGYVDILARAVEVNAGVYAREGLTVVAGRNRVSADGKSVKRLPDDGSARPEVAIDMSQMGGMYSGAITMTATEAGVGVRNRNGQVQAGRTLTISSEGQLSWQSDAQNALTQAGADIRLSAQGDITTHGKMRSGGMLAVQSHEGSLTQSGTLAAAGDMHLNATRDIKSRGHLLSKKNLTVSAHRVDISNAQVSAGKAVLSAREGGVALRQSAIDTRELVVNTEGDVEAQQAKVSAGCWTVDANSLFSQQAIWSQTGGGNSRFTLTGALDNRKGTIEADYLTLTAGQLINQRGRLVTLGDSVQHWRVGGLLDNTAGMLGSNELHLNAGRLDNPGGTLQSRAGLTVHSGETLSNAGGSLLAGQSLRLDAGGDLNNQQGRLNAGTALTVHIDGELNNRRGILHSGEALRLESAQVNNPEGQLQSAREMTLKTGTLDNSDQGTLSSQAALDVQAGHLSNREGGLILGSDRTRITARHLDNTAGRLQSSGQLLLRDISTLDNSRGHILAAGNLDINAERSPTDSPLALLNSDGQVESAGHLRLNARTLNNQNGNLTGWQALTLSLQQDYTRKAGETLSSNGAVTFSLGRTFTSLADWLLPGELILTSASITNPASIVSKTLQLTTGALKNSGRLEADNMTLSVDSLENTGELSGGKITLRGRVIDNLGAAAVMAATKSLQLVSGERLLNRDGALLYSGDSLHLHSDDLIENRESFIEAGGDVRVGARRLNNLRTGLMIERGAEKNAYKWHRYHYYWRSFGSGVNTDKNTQAPTTQRLTFRDDTAAKAGRYGTLLAIDAQGKRAQVRVRNNTGQLTDLWVNYLALKPNSDGSYAMTFYETRGANQLSTIPTPYHNGFHQEFNWTKVVMWDPEKYVDISSAPFITDYNNFRERSESGTVTRDRLVDEGHGARILAGGNMLLHITGQLLNDASTISASGHLTQDGGGKVDNRGYSVNERRQAAISDHYDRDTNHWYPSFNRDETTALSTVDGVITGNGTVSLSGRVISSTTVNPAQISQLEAALNAVDAERAERERNPLFFATDHSLLSSERALTRFQHLDRVAWSLPDHGLFSQPRAPGSPYLVVTDERFTRRDNFVSSDYLLARVGYSPAQTHKRLGDGFYEQRLVSEQVLRLTGKPSVKGWDAMEQYRQLMNHAATVSQDFALVPGVALTPEQIAALQQDIVWLVSEQVKTASGLQTVWVPKVYLAQSTLRLTGNGAVTGGGNLQLSANSIIQAGTLFADKALTVKAGEFLHQAGDIRAGSIDVQADRLSMSTHLQEALRQATMSADDIRLSGSDITLSGAKLNASRALSLSAQRDLTITAAHSSHTAEHAIIAGSMGNRTRDGIEASADRLAYIRGEWQQAQGSELNSGGDLLLHAGRDVTFTASQGRASGSTRVQAGGDIRLLAGKTTTTTHLDASSVNSRVSNDRREERLTLSQLGGDQGVSMMAGQQLLAEGAQVSSAQGRTDIHAQAVTIKDARSRTQDRDIEHKQEGHTRSQRIEENDVETSTGSTFSGRDGVTLFGHKGDITVTGSTLRSEQGDIALRAEKNLTLNTARERESHFREEQTEKTGFLSKSGQQILASDRITREQGTLLSGNRVSASAGHDMTVTGSAIAADRDVNLQAGHHVDILAATLTESHFLQEEKKKSGLLGSGGIGFMVGRQSSKHRIDEHGTIQSRSLSTVGSHQGNVSIKAGNRLHIGGADLVAGRDLALTGDSVTIDPGYDQYRRKESFEQKQSGLSVMLSGSVGSALNTAVSSAQQAGQESDGRLRALHSIKAGLSGVQAAQAWERDKALTAPEDAKKEGKGSAQRATNTLGITATFGSQSSNSETLSDSRQSQGSTLSAGQTLSITATGKNHDTAHGDIAITGSQLTAGNRLSLKAERDIDLQSARNSESHSGKNSSKGGNLGVGIGVGSGGNGIGIHAGLNAGKGHENGKAVTQSDTTLMAGGYLSLSSGRDTMLKGAQASGEKVSVEAGRHLQLESRQDSDHYEARQQQASLGGSLTLGPMSGEAYLNLSQDKLRSRFESVRKQTGLFAGNEGYDVRVRQHTRLDGALIAGSADRDKNSLDTGTLAWKDIHNQADYQTEHSGASFSTGGSIGGMLLSNMAAIMLSGAGHSGQAADTTKAGVSPGRLTIRDSARQQQDIAQLNRDTGQTSNGSISPIFNKEKEQNRLKQARLIGETGSQVMDIIRTQGEIAGLKAKTDPAALAQAREQLEKSDKPVSDKAVMEQAYNNAMQPYGTGSNLQKAAQAVTGAVMALSGGNLAGALASGASPYLAAEIKKRTGSDIAVNAMAHAVLGAVVAHLNNQSAIAGGLGAGGGELAARVIADKLFHADTPEKIAQLSESEKQQISALSQLVAGVAGSLATADTGGAITGGQAGKNAIENNYLSSKQQAQKDKEIAECQTMACKAGAQAKWAAIDLGQDGSFAAGMIAGVPAGLYDAVDGIVKTASSPVETYEALKALFNSGDVLGNVSDAVKQSYIDRINQMETEYQKAGASGSFNAGVEGGKLVTDIAGLLAGGAGVVKGGAVLTEKVVIKAASKVGSATIHGGKATVINFPNKVLGDYSAIKLGPLDNDLAKTFSGSRYQEVVLKQDTILYRGGVSDKPFGQFYSSEPPQGVVQTRIDKAVLPKWPEGATSPIDSSIAIKIPAGTKVYVGEVGSQNGFYVGGTQQIVVPKAWSIKGAEVMEIKPLK